MTTYTPDTWVVLKFIDSDNNSLYKVLAGWYGGFTQGDSWKLSSVIEKIIDKDTFYEIHNYSGSVYKCYKEIERMSGMTSSIYQTINNQMKVELVDISQILDEFK